MGNSPSNPLSHLGTEVEPAAETRSAIIRNHRCPEKLISLPFEEDEPEINTLTKVFERATRLYGDNEMLGIRSYLEDGKRGDYQFETYSQVGTQVTKIASALNKLEIGSNDSVGILSINRPEWIKTLLGLLKAGAICVPLYDTLGAKAVSFILNDADVTITFTTADRLDKLVEDIGEVKTMKTVVCFDDVDDEERKKVEAADLTLYTWNQFLDLGSDEPVEVERQPEDLAYFMYTSGTTGNPKGVQLSNKNILAAVAGLMSVGVSLYDTDVYFSYLPLAHIFETCLQVLGLCFGSSVGFFQGNIRLLMDDIAALRPTVFAGVPRVYSRIYDKVMQTVEGSGWLKKNMFDTAFKNQLENVNNGTRNAMWDTLVFNKVKARLGGRVRMMATGGAPMPAHIMDFLRVAFVCDVFQGYGMTENAAAAMVTPPGYLAPSGKVGEPIACCEIKLEDVSEMEYTHNDKPYPRGEVCIRGHNVFSGYKNLPEKTAEAIDADGWLHTGDIGQILEDGAIQIIDRKKNIFKLAQGEYVAAEELEGVFKKVKGVGQIWIYGNSFNSTLIAVIVPDPEAIMPWCKENGINGEFKDAVTDQKVADYFLEEMKKLGKAEKIASFKIPADVIIENEINENGQGFSTENDTLTPTFKLRRPQLLKRYKEQIDSIYEKRDGKGSSK